jgi:hypothetical protein
MIKGAHRTELSADENRLNKGSSWVAKILQRRCNAEGQN